MKLHDALEHMGHVAPVLRDAAPTSIRRCLWKMIPPHPVKAPCCALRALASTGTADGPAWRLPLQRTRYCVIETEKQGAAQVARTAEMQRLRYDTTKAQALLDAVQERLHPALR
ncbi:hypothetical protein [Azohydromonas aeria]|uniref:hypothetical protein n=1 Tax=Azohydromonas aeria TaxID=2590212 RepID=UPI0012FA9A9A|nr:hypothetical protein [Azohydromonas aeria]